ncbi:hypothetical protein BH11CYA1_BH11CYA1_22450 [soil metagenome]
MKGDMLENAPFGMLSLDRAFNILESNEAARRLVGASCLPAESLQSLDGLKEICLGLTKWLETLAETVQLETHINGRYLEFQCWSRHDKTLVYVLIKDVTQERSETARMKLLMTAVEQAWESVCITDAELEKPGPHFVYSNHGYEALMGYREDEILGLTPRIHQGPLTDKAVLARLKENLSEGSNFHGEAINYKKDGTPFWLEWKISPVKNDQGKIVNYIAFQRDITPLKDAQQRSRDLSSIMAHELKAPLASINGALGLLQLSYEPETADELLTIGIDSVQRLLRLINDILEVEKIEDRKFDLKLNVFSVRRLFNLVQQTLQNYIPENNLHIAIDVPDDLEVYGDLDRLTQVLINLTSNALKYSPKGGTVTLSAYLSNESGDGNVRILVKDQGPGIRQENLSKLFSRFQQLVPEDGVVREGSGVGLAIAKSLVEAHGGKIGAESRVGEGSTFWCELKGHSGQSQRSSRVARSLLLVDDNELFASFIKQRMTALGYLVNRVASLNDIGDALKAFTPQICIIDSALEGAQEAVAAIDSKKLEIPIVTVSGFGADSDGLISSICASKLSAEQFIEQLQLISAVAP